jgi:tape measure domain-containing protein
MAGKLSFSIAINLVTENFRKGTNQVKSAFRSMQAQILAFSAAVGVGGIGLSNLVSRFIEVARETGRAQTALKNVSGSMTQYADNQAYLIQMSKKYGLEINALTNNYAKFTASASVSGMAMADQRKIFESMSRAVSAFGLSSEDSNRAFMALSQMMSKGKISSEELRQQLGEQIPIAMQAMAKAAGTTVAGLDDLLKQGKLMSADVLPKFADALNEMIPNVSTDNLETSINRLKNTFTELTNSLDIQGKYKGLVDWFNGLISGIEDKLTGLATFVGGILGVKMLKSLYSYYNKFSDVIDRTVKKAEIAETQKQDAAKKRADAQMVYEEALSKYQKAKDEERLRSLRELQNAEKALNRAELAEKEAIDAAKVASEQAAAVQTTNIWRKSVKTIKLALASIWVSLKPFLLTGLITGVSALIGYFVNLRKEAQRVKNLLPDYQKEMDKVANTEDVSKMQKLLEIVNDRKRSQEEINAAQQELQKMIGGEKLTQDELNKKVKERIELLKQQARAQLAASTVAKTEERQRKLVQKSGITEAELGEVVKLWKQKNKFGGNEKLALLLDDLSGGGLIKRSRITGVLDEYIQNQRVLNQATDDLAKSQAEAAKLVTTTTTGTTTGAGTGEQTELQKQQESYAKALRELEAKRKVEGMTVDEYNKQLASITGNALVGALSSTDTAVSESGWAKQLAEQYRKAMIDITASTANQLIDEMQQAIGSEDIRAEATPILRQRDTTFDYKKTELEKLTEELDIWKELKNKLYEELQDGAVRGADVIQKELNNAIENVSSLEDAIKIAEVQQDIQDLKKQLNENLYDGIKNIASSSDRMVSAFESLRDVLNDVDATGWEKIMAVWNAIINTVDGVGSIINTIDNISAISAKLAGAEQSSKDIVAGKVAEVAANQVATEVEIAGAKRKTEAAVTEMAAKSTAAYAAIPFAGAGLAAAQIAAMTAMIQAAKNAIPGFRDGGIVVGPAAGDRVLARMNGGEMVLTTAQQSRLFRMLDEGGPVGRVGNLTSSVTTKVRAKDLILTINNELKSQGKKTIS